MKLARLAAAALAIAAIACAGARLTRSTSPPPPPPTPVPTVVAVEDAGEPPPVPCSLTIVGPDGFNGLERVVAGALREARFEEVVDLSPGGESACTGDAGCQPVPMAHRPSVDVAVIAFEPGCAPAFADAMMSRDFPGVHVSRRDPTTLAITGVRFRRWDQARWDAEGEAPAAFTEADDIVPPRRGEATIDFTVPYPASNFKLLVAVELLAQVDRGKLKLSDTFEHAKKKRPLNEWLEDMITWSDDESTQAIVRKLHAVGVMDRLSDRFAKLGLGTLQIHDTSRTTGRSWHPGRIHMGAWDTARLLWLLDPDAPPPSWPVDAAFLSPAAKAQLVTLLGAQAYHDVLTTTALCGTPLTAKGIPALLPERWINPEGHFSLEGTKLDVDVRPCNAAAAVTFAHKTGLTFNFGSDAGIVRGIPGRSKRHYVIAFFSNLGHRYTDADKSAGPPPCDTLGICYTQRIGALGATIDAAVTHAVDR